eukprot:scaffold346_cov347-Pavlova_lutheri.AAC.45
MPGLTWDRKGKRAATRRVALESDRHGGGAEGASQGPLRVVIRMKQEAWDGQIGEGGHASA